MPQVANQGVPQGGLALAGAVPGEQIIDQLVDGEPVDPPRREERAKLAAGGLLQSVNHEQSIKIIASEDLHSLVEMLLAEHREVGLLRFQIPHQEAVAPQPAEQTHFQSLYLSYLRTASNMVS